MGSYLWGCFLALCVSGVYGHSNAGMASNTVRVYLVDTSGSMDGSKKDQLCRQVESDKIDHLYAFGSKIRGKLNPSQLRDFPFNDGTDIQNCLLDMFSRLQNEVSGSKKYFVFITDAEDKLSDVDGLKRAWEQCKDYHKKKGGYINASPVFIDQGPDSCVDEIKKVFGTADMVDATQVEEIMKNISRAIEIASGCDKELDLIAITVENIDKQSSEAEKQLNQSREQVKEIKKDVTSIGEQAVQFKGEIQSLEQEIDTIVDLSNRNEINKCLEETKDEVARLEMLQIDALTKSETVLTNIEMQSFNVLQAQRNIAAQQSDVDNATDSAKKAVTEVTSMQKEVNKLKLRLTSIDKNTVQNVLEDIEEVSKNVIEQMKKLQERFRDASSIERQLRKTKIELQKNKVSLDKSAQATNALIDKLLAIKI